MKRRKTGRKTATTRSARKATRRVVAAKGARVAELVRERDEALHQQAATAEILKLISSSPDDTQPVFDAIVQSGLKIFPDAAIFIALPDGDMLRAAAFVATDPNRAEMWARRWPIPLTREYMHSLAFLDRKIVDIPDAREPPPKLAVGAKNFLPTGYRALTIMPLMRGRTAIGTLSVVRLAPGKLSKRQVAALKTYASQAVIAIENTRLLNELRQRTGDLSESLEQQTATSEVLKVISSSSGELEPVFKAMLENAVRICGARFGNLALYDGSKMRVAALHNAPRAFEELRRSDPVVPLDRSVLGIIVQTKKVAHISDMTAEEPYASWALVKLAGARAVLGVPMLREGELVGAIVIYRTEPAAFSEKQIELLTNFAAQAVIAIENTRLLNELRQRTNDLSESLEQQTATSEILKVISGTPGQLEPVFQTILENATQICEAKFGVLFRTEGDAVRCVAMHGAPKQYAEERRRSPVIRPAPATVFGRALATKQPAQIADIRDEIQSSNVPSGYTGTQLATLAGARTVLAVPMLKDDELVGGILIFRQEVREFTDKQIELVSNFAAQAVIAIENARLLNELRQRTDDLSESLEQQTATSQVLSVISSSVTDAQPVFDMIADSAARLCEAQFCFVYRFDGQLLHFVAHRSLTPEVFEINRRAYPAPPNRASVASRAILERRVVQIPDVNADAEYGLAEMAAVAGYRSAVAVPILRDDVPVGCIAITRAQVGLLPDRQIDLLKTFAGQAVIAIENTRLFEAEQHRTAELSELLEQQTATSEVLKVISSSPGDLERVFQAMLENAVRICDASFGMLFRNDGGLMNAEAMVGVPPQFAEFWRRGPQRPGPRTAFARVIETRQTVHIDDVKTEPAYVEGEPIFVAAVNLGGFRTLLNVPMLKENELIGVIAIYRQEVRAFTDKEVELLSNFAAQAVIAIENTRLLSELRESLQQQTATADVLKLISRSTFDLQAVLDTLTTSAIRLCQADKGAIFVKDGDPYRLAAHSGFSPEEAQLAEQYAREHPLEPGRGSLVGRVAMDGNVVHIEDVLADAEYQANVYQKAFGYRTNLGVPLLREGAVVGVFALMRNEVNAFSEKEIELVSTFANQAVIAIENARLLNELRESLEQQTATADVLKVISSSPGEMTPVFEAMLANALRICEAKFGHLLLYDGECFHATHLHDVPAAYREYWQKHGPIRPGLNTGLARIAREKKMFHITDLKADAAYAARDPLRVVTVEQAGARSFVGVPMLKDDKLVGAIVIYRQEVRPFSDKQIELLTNFAAQAVIAIENTRLLNELRERTDDLSESLEQQTATSEVLKVISSSPGNLDSVFTAMLENATRVCEAKHGFLFRAEGDGFRVAAILGDRAPFIEQMKNRALKPGPQTPIGRLKLTRQIVHVPDLSKDQGYLARDPLLVTAVEQGQVRSVLVVPMIKDGELIGAIGMHRREVRPFTEKQIELLKNFASQAVIAIENTRLLSELRESLQQQTATSDVLKVISRSTFDLQTVLDTLVESAARLCGAEMANIWRPRDGGYRLTASYGVTARYKEYLENKEFLNTVVIEPGRGTTVGRVLLERKTVHIHDIQADSDYRLSGLVALGGYRTMLGVPILREGEPIGVFVLVQSEVRPFTGKQIDLATTFADQAAIAIENVRLFDEVQTRTRDLSESLQQQTATADVLKVISSSPGSLEPVFQAILQNATQICQAGFGTLNFFEDGAFRSVALHNPPPEFKTRLGEIIHPHPHSGLAHVARTKQIAHIEDIKTQKPYLDGDPAVVKLADGAGARTLLIVPMLKDDRLVGVISIYRQEVRLFTDKQIELVKNFAAQAVIAIENTRLLNELRESLQQQTATADVLKVISRSTFDLNAVLRTLVESATQLCEAEQAIISQLSDDGLYRIAANFGFSREFEEWARQNPFKPERGTITGRTALEGKVVHVPDVLADPEYTFLEGQKLGGYRSNIGVPLLRDGVVIGVFVLTRPTVKPFTDKQIELVRIFADQAVIAIENARLLNELRDSLQQQTATSQILEVISNSPTDTQPAFDAIVRSGLQLFPDAAVVISLPHADTVRLGALATADAADKVALEARYPMPLSREYITGTAILERREMDIADASNTPLQLIPGGKNFLASGYRAITVMPMMRGETTIGALSVARREPGALSEKQKELLRTFAAQAVIAIENTRLFNELRESLQQQTATADVLKVISSSPGDLEPVFKAMLEKATQLCDAKFGIMFRFADGVFRATSWMGDPPAHIIEHPHVVRENPHNLLTRIVTTKQPVHSPDLTKEQAYIEGNPRYRALVDTVGARSLLVVPMLKNEDLIGAIAIYWQEARSFTEKQMELISNFAAQAVIAIDNARLLSELRESLQQQTATSDVLKVISRSTFDLQAVLDTLVESAARVCEADTGIIRRRDGDIYPLASTFGLSVEQRDLFARYPARPDRGSVFGRAILEGRTIHVPDLLADPDLDQRRLRDYAGVANMRSGLGVPLMREGAIVGVFTLQRREPRPFTDKQIELVTTFADQAVIAIENVRLFDEVQARTRELAASLEDLRTAQDRLVQTQKLASLGQLTAGIAHEIKNPLNFVNNFSAISTELIDELQDTLKGISLDGKRRAEVDELTTTLRSNLDKVVQHGKRADAIVKNMLLHSREGSGEHRLVDINALVEESLNLAYHGARAEKQGFNITLERSFDAGTGTADLFPQEITRVLLNLIVNGFYAASKRKAEAGGNGYEPTLTAATRSLGDSVEIRIRDNGTGILPEVKEKIFNPFFTTKPAGEGTGLGLSLSHDIVVKQHGGSIEVDTRPGEFTEFRIILPRTGAASVKAE